MVMMPATSSQTCGLASNRHGRAAYSVRPKIADVHTASNR